MAFGMRLRCRRSCKKGYSGSLEMREALEELNNALRNEGSPEINTGVGINTDRVLSVIG